MPLAELPVITEAQLRAFLAAADALFAAADAVLVVQPKAATGNQKERPCRIRANGSDASDGSFFKQVNRAALDNLPRWVPRVFGDRRSCRRPAHTASPPPISAATSEEDLSIHPDGVQDFGPRRGSPLAMW